MSTPQERFKDGYSNHRWNPFTDADMAVDKTEDDLYIPGSAPFVLQLLEVARKDTPSSVAIYNYDDIGYMSEVDTPPTQGQFRVDYPAPDGEGTGLVEFNSNDNGKRIRVEYKATGSPIVSEFLDSKVSWPAGSPGQNQVVIFKSGVPAWAYNPVRYFHEGNALYHASGEGESCFLFRFKKDLNQTKVLLELKGAKVHQGYYTELASHQHDPGALAAEGVGPHYHAVNAHAHAAGDLAGSQPLHLHGGVTMGGSGTSWGGDDGVTISGSTENASPNTNEGGDHSHALTGQTAAAGVTPKAYPDQLKVYIDGTDRTAALLALLGWTKFGDGTSTHAFVVNGTGDLDITSYLIGGIYHEIIVSEPIAFRGGRVLLHCELY